MKQGYEEPVYTIGIAAKLLKVCPATLRIWERKGLIRITRMGKNRFYSQCNIDRLEHIKKLLQEDRVNIEGVKKILDTTYCWDIKQCSPKTRKSCLVFRRRGKA
jgi:MerR family transcriptional regulator/heat shock protein HspR